MKIKKVAVFTFTSKYASQTGEPAPEDMLRYDGAFVHDAHPGVLVFPTMQDKGGVFNRKPTFGRWQSFGITLTEVDAQRAFDITEQFKTRIDEWYTIRRPQGSTTDYKRFTLREHLDAKFISDLK